MKRRMLIIAIGTIISAAMFGCTDSPTSNVGYNDSADTLYYPHRGAREPLNVAPAPRDTASAAFIADKVGG